MQGMPGPTPIHLGRRMGTGIPIFNHAHRLASGCIAAYVPGAFPGGTCPNLVTPGVGDLITRTGAIAYPMTPDGMSFGPTGTAAQGLTGPTPASGSWRLSTTQSLFVRAQKIATATNNHPSNLIGVNSASTPFNCYAMGFGGTAAGGGGAITIYQTSVSAGQTGSIVPPVGKMFTALATMVPGPGIGPNLWINGVQDTVASTTTVNVVYNGAVTTNCGTGSSSNPIDANITAGYIWAPRLLVTQDAQYLDENPYCLLLWQEDLMMANLVGVTPIPPVPTTNKSLILSPLTVGLGGAAAAERWLRRRKVQMRRLRGE